jgi:hypothetical protein
MNHHDPFRDATLPELLAAYADGELNAAERGRVEGWLAANSNGLVELETQRRFGRPLWPASNSPSEDAWQRVLKSVHVAVSAPRPAAPSASRVSRRRLLTALAAVAAVIILAFIGFPRDSGEKGGPGRAEDALAVATADDVEIMRIFEVDVDRLVVGEPPLRRSIVLATFEDVEGLKAARDTDGMMPLMALQPANAPMVVAPMVVK